MEHFEECNKSYINGEWVEGAAKQTYDNLNPYDDSTVTTFSLATATQLEEAFEAASEAQKQWAASTTEDRKRVVEDAVDYLKKNHDEIVDTIVKESGGTVLKGNVEMHLTIEVLEEALHYAGEVGNVKEVPSAQDGKVNQIHRRPLGVISSISPFNFPMNLSMRTIAPAIALGNSVVHKPDIQVGLTGGVILAKAFEYAGLPKGVFNMVLTDIPEIGDGMITNDHAQLISFTGSTAVGKHIGEIAGRNLKPVALELGGNSPFVVLSDADVDQAVNAAVFGKFIHQGQICMIINRIIVHQDKYNQFAEKFYEKVKDLPVGDPSNPETVIGPLVNKGQMEKALGFIDEAKKEGATALLEGKQQGNVLTPSIFTNVNNRGNVAQSELFGPIALIIKAETDDEAINMANDTDRGLSSAIFTSDLQKGEKYALELDAGMTHINDQTVNDAPNIPFGGNKASGMGRFGNPWVVEEFTSPKWISVQKTERPFPF
ncbi:aldehyde dehydrogenase family protein [Salibacterium salarium]|uniref:Aldehyde dehydrogenase family protein n=1 Tax=Salibacterium salarium TaxID=284579 RepID=A0A3R9WU23_9BACI|nr:aldehyde dehydrogenase family protein [Salibacterium salarium]RSL33564.1 aldehyde dehydrogenase family protein [Salibacterium salarium]